MLAPIQDEISLRAAIEAGADAVYFGMRGFNMRAGAKNFTVKDLRRVVKLCHQHQVKAYLALNIIIYENELIKVRRILEAAQRAGIDAVIGWDMSVLRAARALGLEVHLSTQASVANSEAAEFYRRQGVKRIVLARECSLEDIKKIKRKVKVGIEVFIHGAMCVSVSGRCFMSQFMYNRSANRGECLQPCRRKYLIKQIDGDKELELGEDYVLSPKDLCTLPFIEKILESGVDSLKIEGRNRSPEYVKTVVSVYRRAIDYYFDGKNIKTLKHLPADATQSALQAGKNIKARENKSKDGFEELKKKLMAELETVYNRGFSAGFYLGKPLNEWAHSYGSQATMRKVHIGRVVHYYGKIKVAEIEIQAKQKLRLGEQIIVEGPKTGVYEQTVNSMQVNHQPIKRAGQGDRIAIKLDKTVRKNDQVYKLQKIK